ncbi:MAG: CRISPR-associated endonuclease Cas1 [Candidatus Jordarchaeales archaeon]
MLPLKRFYGRGFLLGVRGGEPFFSYRGVEERVGFCEGDVVVAEGACSVSTGFLFRAVRVNVPVVFVGAGKLSSATHPRRMLTVRGQVEAFLRGRDELALRFARAAVLNKAEALRLFCSLSGDDGLADAASGIERIASRISDPMALEGEASRRYFEALAKIIPEEYGFAGRTRRPPKDPVNAALSYGYVVLASKCRQALWMVGLNPCIGFLHALHGKRASLALDLEEEFRQPIVDAAVVPLFMSKSLGRNLFTYRAGGVLLNKRGRRVVAAVLGERERRVIGDVALGDVPFLQALRLAAYFRGECDYQPFLWTFSSER